MIYSLTRAKLCETTWPLMLQAVVAWLWHHYVLDVLSVVLSPFWLDFGIVEHFSKISPIATIKNILF